MKTNRENHTAGAIGRYIIEVRDTLAGARELREAILSLTYSLQKSPARKGLLVIVSSRVTGERISSEWEDARSVFRPEIMRRAHLVRIEQGKYIGLPTDFGKKAKEQLDNIVTASKVGKDWNRRDRFSYFEIMRVLLVRWLNNEGPITTRQVTIESGYSYPTVAKALQRLKRYLRRNPDRRIELSRFPHEEWARLIVLAEDARETRRYVDRSGNPRPAESLIKRISGLHRPNVAIGGVYGAKYHDPDLDIVGSPRLDLTLSHHHGQIDLEFVSRLDPALEPSEDLSEPAVVVVHVSRGHGLQFSAPAKGLIFADPIECLLDLHEARLETQAAEFLEALIRKKARTNG